MLLDPTQARRLYQDAVDNHYAVLAVNADSHAAVTDCLGAAAECDAPVIIETSLWQLTGRSYGAGDPIMGMDRYLADLRAIADSPQYADVPVVYHTDHIKGPATESILKHAIEAGASSISLDSSELSHEQNIALLSALCAFADERDQPATLEMEAGVDDGVTPLEETRDLFGEVEKRHPGYLALWAPGVGTKHGLADDATSAFSPEAVAEHRALASELAGRPIGIALHGSSGLPDAHLKAAVEAGVAKVNWSSESLLIRSGAARDYYAGRSAELEKKHPRWKATAMDNGVQEAVSAVYTPRVAERIRTLGGDGHGRSFLGRLAAG